jgi:hypothetical protein
MLHGLGMLIKVFCLEQCQEVIRRKTIRERLLFLPGEGGPDTQKGPDLFHACGAPLYVTPKLARLVLREFASRVGSDLDNGYTIMHRMYSLR